MQLSPWTKYASGSLGHAQARGTVDRSNSARLFPSNPQGFMLRTAAMGKCLDHAGTRPDQEAIIMRHTSKAQAPTCEAGRFKLADGRVLLPAHGKQILDRLIQQPIGAQHLQG